MIVFRIAALIVMTWVGHSFATTHGYWPHGEFWGVVFGVGMVGIMGLLSKSG